ncbi:Glucan 1,3-beta-glucosidase 3 [Leucoagaricus sp. SymC.cos]|nr:Glucan 1,3-beta-glucosidase 3 [Leucoagaricus sp. SymC.cos]
MYNLTTVLAALRLSQSLVNPSPGATSSDTESEYKFAEHSVLKGVTKDHGQDCHVDPYNVPVQAPSFPPFDQTEANVFRYRQQQGVNLGSWFVHEQWMTPSLFQCASPPKVSEIDIAAGWGSMDNARAVLERHWDTFITENDLTYLASIGINTVRLPIAYFTLGPQFMIGTPFEPYSEVYKNAWPRLLRAIRQAGDAGIGVLVDMHGAPGSQNGQQHSGISDGQTNFFNSYDYQRKTIEALKFLVQQLGPITNVIGVQLLNEPFGHPSLENFYTQATDAIRESSWYGQRMPVYIHDGFDLGRFGPYINNRPDFVIQDHHSYFVFTDDDSRKPAYQHTKDVKGGIASAFWNTASGERRNLVIGEWSCALTEESLKNHKDKVQARKDFCTAQMEVYSNVTAGWMFWSLKNEQCDFDPGWCFQHAIGTVLPNTFYTYGDITNTYQAQAVSAQARRLEYPSDEEVTMILTQSSDDGRRPEAPKTGPTANAQHRFEAIHQRQNGDANQPPVWNGTAAMPGNTSTRNSDSSSNDSNSPRRKGFVDGFQTAKVFAIYGMSKLGFTEQYINEALWMSTSRGAVPNGSEQEYRTGFLIGLKCGESKIIDAIRST